MAVDPNDPLQPPRPPAYHRGEVDAETSRRRQAALEELRQVYARPPQAAQPIRTQPAPPTHVRPAQQGGLAKFRAHVRELDRQSRIEVDDVTRAKQRLLSGDDPAPVAQPSRFSQFHDDPRLDILRRYPVRIALAAVILSLLIYKIPLTRTAFRVGMIFALRAAIARLVSRYV
jgi:hypothetical protein